MLVFLSTIKGIELRVHDNGNEINLFRHHN